jgi:hypothetical protein
MESIETIIFAMLRGPQHIPVVHAFSLAEAVRIEYLMNQFVVTVQNFVKQLGMVDNSSFNKIVHASLLK